MIDFIASGAAFLLVFMIMMLFAAMLPARRRFVLGAALAATAATFVIPFGEAGIFFYIRSAMGHFSAALPVAAGFSLASFALRRPAVASVRRPAAGSWGRLDLQALAGVRRRPALRP